MVDFQQLKDAEVDTLQAQIDGWIAASQTMNSQSNAARTGVAAGIRHGKWEAVTGTAAIARSDTMAQELANATTEADSIKWLLWTATRYFKSEQAKLKKVIAEVDGDPNLSIDGNGHVKLTPPSELKTPSEALNTEYRLALGKVHKLNKQIKRILSDASGYDVMIAQSLRAAANADQPHNLSFNPNAPTDGSLGATVKQLIDHYRIDKAGFAIGGYDLKAILEGAQQGLQLFEQNHDLAELLRAHDHAEKVADERFGSEQGSNGRKDAMKHTLAAAMMARDLGEESTRTITDGHERDPANKPKLMTMDRHNNEIGFRIARENPHATDEQLENLVSKAIQDGEILTINKHSRLEYTDGRGIPQ